MYKIHLSSVLNVKIINKFNWIDLQIVRFTVQSFNISGIDSNKIGCIFGHN